MSMSKKILVVDDEPDVLRVLTFRLKRIGYDVISATDGKEALVLAMEEIPDVILLDLVLPEIDGYEVCRRIRADEKVKHIPIIFLTASIALSMSAQIETCGADDYVIKPFDFYELEKKIKGVLKT